MAEKTMEEVTNAPTFWITTWYWLAVFGMVRFLYELVKKIAVNKEH
jgi:hypothetical protein